MITRTNYVEYRTPQFRRLSDSQLSLIYNASLEILDRTGVYLHDQEALDLLKKAGARIMDGNRAHIPSNLVEWALSVAPKQIRIYDRNGNRAMPLEGDNVFFGPGSDCGSYRDHKTGELCPGSMEFVDQGIKLCDALPNIDYVMSLCAPAEIEDKDISNRYQMRSMLMNTTKPVVFVSLTLEGCKDAWEMAEIVAGGADNLQQYPTCVEYINYAHPLRHNEEALQRLLYSAGKGLPVIYMAPIAAGASSPITPAGGFALSNAGSLVGIVLAQLKRPSSPVIPAAYHMNSSMSLSQRCISEAPRTLGARGEIGHYMGLPVFGKAGDSSAKVPDQQATAQAALSLITEAISGTNLIHDVGYIGGADIYSFQMLVICDELIEYVRRFMRGIEVNDDTLALDVIHEMGHGGNYMAHKHTMKYFRDEWYPDILLDEETYDEWVANGSKTLAQRAGEKIDKLLEEHQPEPLPDDTVKKLDEIVDRAANK